MHIKESLMLQEQQQRLFPHSCFPTGAETQHRLYTRHIPHLFMPSPVESCRGNSFSFLWLESIQYFAHALVITGVQNQVCAVEGPRQHFCGWEWVPGPQITPEHIHVPTIDTHPCLLRNRSAARAPSPNAVTYETGRRRASRPSGLASLAHARSPSLSTLLKPSFPE